MTGHSSSKNYNRHPFLATKWYVTHYAPSEYPCFPVRSLLFLATTIGPGISGAHLFSRGAEPGPAVRSGGHLWIDRVVPVETSRAQERATDADRIIPHNRGRLILNHDPGTPGCSQTQEIMYSLLPVSGLSSGSFSIYRWASGPARPVPASLPGSLKPGGGSGLWPRGRARGFLLRRREGT